tara:strand:+ start:2626 stop:3291 length:666 start_codon:yes stop_codon:yes gene_type:complete
MKEEFRVIKGFEDYKVSNFGNVVRKKNISIRFDKDGYSRVNLSKNGKSKTIKIHQLVAIAFLNHTPNGNKIVVDHIDNVKSNNRLDNLQLITHRENSNKDRLKGSSSFLGVSWVKRDKVWRSRISIDGKPNHLGTFKSQEEASKAYQLALKKLKNNNMKFDLNLVENVEIEGVDMADYPDFCDAFIVAADYDGVPMTEDQILELEENYPDWKYEQVENSLY